MALPPFPGPAAWSVHGTIDAGLQRLAFNDEGVPQQSPIGTAFFDEGDTIIRVSDEKELKEALREAKAGDIITLAPGTYRFRGRRISIGEHGTPGAPIYVRAEKFGDVRIELDMLEGFFVDKSYWVFENLIIHGTCHDDSHCEHAFHVVGPAVGTTIRNNELVDFNAALKVNGLFSRNRGTFPDFGLVQNNSVYNTRQRRTDNPVSLLNINAATGWVVSANYIADFSKSRGNRVSYAAFMKSNSMNGIFERNIIVCNWRVAMKNDETRIGLSFGGGGSDRKTSRDGENATEHSFGVIRNNIIVRCPGDVGIYLNRSASTWVHNNLLINSAGIDVRFSTSSASLHNNIIEGRIRDRDGGTHTSDHNLISSECGLFSRFLGNCSPGAWYVSAISGDFRLMDMEHIFDQGNTNSRSGLDFCGNPRLTTPDLGPIEYDAGPFCLPKL